MTLKAPKVEAEAKTENVLDDDIPIRKEPTLAELKAERTVIESIAEAVYVQKYADGTFIAYGENTEFLAPYLASPLCKNISGVKNSFPR